jgi:hypothetical protein
VEQTWFKHGSNAVREIIAVHFQNNMKHTNTFCGQNVEILCAKAGGTYSIHYDLKV